jgi:hypothetical protein
MKKFQKEDKMELGNMIFGNSRGAYPLKRGVGFEEEFERLNSLFQPSDYVEEFENDTFAVFPYYWGDCTCDFEAYEFRGEHLVNCYQSELKAEKRRAGAELNKWGFYEFPNSWSWDKRRENIYKKLTEKYNLPMRGCAVHCTCDYEQRYEAWMEKIGYPDGHKADCLLLKSNFHYKPTDFQIQWYKYPFRDSYTNREISLLEFSTIINDCIESLKEDRKFLNLMRGKHISSAYWNRKREALNKEGWLCHRCMRGVPLKNKKVICDMVERNWQGNENVAILMIPDGTEIDWRKECEAFVACGNEL